MTTNCVLQRNRKLQTSSSHMIVNTTPPRNSEATVSCNCCMIAKANTCDQLAFRPPSQISLCEALKTKRGSKSRSLGRQTSPHATQTATITYGSCLNHVTHGAHPINPCCSCFACTNSKPSRCEPRLADLVNVLCSIQMGHDIFPPLTFPSKTPETERWTSTTTFNNPSHTLTETPDAQQVYVHDHLQST